MSLLTITWSMAAAACWVLGLLHLFLWFQKRSSSIYLLSSIMALSAGANAMLELGMLSTQSLESYRMLARWGNYTIFLILIPMVWFIQLYFASGRRWLAVLITLLWTAGISVNFFSEHSLTFNDVTGLQQQSTFWGETFTVPLGSENPWKYLSDMASLLIIFYVADASIRLWRHGSRQRAATIGGGILFFILAAGIHTPLVDAGILETPYMISFAFLAIVIAMSYQLAMDALRARDAEKELQQTRRSMNQLARVNMLGECTSMIAHELNQPLTAILSNAQAARRYLESRKEDSADIIEILNDIVRDDKRASDIIHRLRQMVQKDGVVQKRFDLNASIVEVTKILSRDLQEKNIRIETRLSNDLPLLGGGQIEIQQVVLNFITNAVKAIDLKTGSSRLIIVKTARINNNARVDVEDSGAGIAEDVQDTLFNHFVSDDTDGLGLGLAISRRIIESCGGQIFASNKKTGGAVFSFTLPLP
ncbi:MAG: sensor histidine kinase [Arenicellales bacterium]